MNRTFPLAQSKTCIALLLSAFMGFASLDIQAQTQTVVQSFNGTNNNSTTELGYDGNPTIRAFNAQGGTNIGSSYYAPTNPTASTSSWGVTNATETVLFRRRQTAINSTDNYIQFRLGAWGLTSSEGLDQADEVNVFVSVNDGQTYSNILRVRGKSGGGDGYWNFTPGTQRKVDFNPATVFVYGPSASEGDSPANRDLNGKGYDNFRINLPPGVQYIRFYIVANCGENELWTIDEVTIGSNSSSPLPVALKSFTAAASAKGTQLQWVTASEKNNAAFEVQRGATAEQFQTIGRVDGQGTSSQGHSYSWVDKQPLLGLSYYRLRQLDYDGTESFSPVAVVQQSTDLLAASFSPNPSAGFVTLAPALGDVQYRVLNSLGQSVLTGKASGGSTVDMQSLRAGSYFLELHSATGRTIERFLRE